MNDYLSTIASIRNRRRMTAQTHCPHGVDLRVSPRCYLCQPAQPATADPRPTSATGWAGHAVETPLDEERLARALDRVEGSIAVRWPLATEVARRKAALIAKAYREDSDAHD